MGCFIFFCIVGLLYLWVNGVKESAIEHDKMWEIFLPVRFSYDHHMKWNDYVKSLSTDLLFLKSKNDEWVINTIGINYHDSIFPVKIKCSKKNMKKIIKFTIQHYNLESVIAYKISDKVLLTHKREIK